MAARGLENGKYQGMNWCSKFLRLGCYLRDGGACSWCSSGIEDGVTLTLDHVIPVSQGGSNAATNLITACRRCNSSRGNRSIEEFAIAVAAYLNHDVVAEKLVQHIENCLSRDIKPFREQAKELVARRGSYTLALHSIPETAR